MVVVYCGGKWWDVRCWYGAMGIVMVVVVVVWCSVLVMVVIDSRVWCHRNDGVWMMGFCFIVAVIERLTYRR